MAAETPAIRQSVGAVLRPGEWQASRPGNRENEREGENASEKPANREAEDTGRRPSHRLGDSADRAARLPGPGAPCNRTCVSPAVVGRGPHGATPPISPGFSEAQDRQTVAPYRREGRWPCRRALGPADEGAARAPSVPQANRPTEQPAEKATAKPANRETTLRSGFLSVWLRRENTRGPDLACAPRCQHLGPLVARPGA
jgi:hypothetical protein